MQPDRRFAGRNGRTRDRTGEEERERRETNLLQAILHVLQEVRHVGGLHVADAFRRVELLRLSQEATLEQLLVDLASLGPGPTNQGQDAVRHHAVPRGAVRCTSPFSLFHTRTHITGQMVSAVDTNCNRIHTYARTPALLEKPALPTTKKNIADPSPLEPRACGEDCAGGDG